MELFDYNRSAKGIGPKYKRFCTLNPDTLEREDLP
jgi:hypothetical protein